MGDPSLAIIVLLDESAETDNHAHLLLAQDAVWRKNGRVTRGTMNGSEVAATLGQFASV